MTETLAVELAGRAYPILVGAGLLAEAGTRIRGVLGDRPLVILSDSNVAPYYLAPLEAALEAAGLRFKSVQVPAGEASKDLHRFPALAETLLACGLERRSVLVALGGGVVGDLTGFAAASLMRGLDFVQIPTSLLAQIDSSVGGKTGVNTSQGKNLVGAFHQPRLVLADITVLSTLPLRELRAGYAEMAKYGVLGDAGFFAGLERNLSDILALRADWLGPAILHCCRMKAEIVARDETEQGDRALLNLGHTFGHAFEAETGFGPALLHGEAVALGMVLAAQLSVRLGRLSAAEATVISRHLAEAGLPTRMAEIAGAPFAADRLLAHMAHDKKVANGKLTFIVPDRIGQSSILRGVDPALVRSVLIEAGAFA